MSEWISVKERLPEEGVSVICLDNGNPNYIPANDDIYVAAWCSRLGSFTDEYMGDHDFLGKRSPTHWMPLPAPPKK